MYGMNGWNKPGGDSISREAAIAVADSSDCVGISVDVVKKVTDEVVKGLKQLPAAQPDKSVIEDCLYHIHRNTSVHTSAEGVVAIKYYMGELWRELFGEEDMPEWMS